MKTLMKITLPLAAICFFAALNLPNEKAALSGILIGAAVLLMAINGFLHTRNRN